MKKNKGKYLAYILRHGFTKMTGHDLPDGGWVHMCVLTELGINRNDIINILKSDNKTRFEMNGECIRAIQGHSIDTNIEYDSKTPPDILFHGTTVGAWMDIKNEGLSKMKRHDVHMTESFILADLNAKRWGGVPLILSIDCRSMENDGYIFKKSLNDVWLIEHVPPKYLKVYKTYWNK